MTDVKIIVENEYEGGYRGQVVAYHIGSETPLCGASKNLRKNTYHGKLSEEDVCAKCRALSKLTAKRLAVLLAEVEDIIAALREDGTSLYEDGEISSAIGNLDLALRNILEEAKNRAFAEVKRK